MLKRSQHAPAHLFLDDTPYFITAAIYQKRKLLTDPALKNTLLHLIHKQFQRYEWAVEHWVILDNHYHLMGKSRNGKALPNILRNIHSDAAAPIIAATSCKKPVWWNYWDYCPRNEKDYLTRVNYLLYNPVKHGYTTDLPSYPFSSFHVFYENLGREQLAKQFREYSEYKTLILHEAYDDDF